MSLRKELIQIYSQKKAVNVEKSNSFQTLLTHYNSSEAFEAEWLIVHSCKLNLENICHGQTTKNQIKFCLKLLSQTKNSKDKHPIYYLLIKYSYYKQWSSSQKEYFDNIYKIVRKNNIFFLSFTNRNSTPGYPFNVNRENRFFIESAFYTKEEYVKKKFTEENLLAQAVYNHLKNRGINGFYYPEHEGKSDDVISKLSKSCNEVLIFIQIIQVSMFDFRDPNYCHFEYIESKKSENCSKQIYIFGENRKDIQNLKYTVEHDWKDWFNEVIEKKDPLQLAPTPIRDDYSVQNNFKIIDEKIINQIKTIYKNLFEDIPH